MPQRILRLVMMLHLAFTASAAVWYVDKDNTSGTEDGTSWTTAFTTIQPAIDAAYDNGGGEVWAAEGVYDERRESVRDVAPGDDLENWVDTGSLLMREGVHLFGGFQAVEVNRDARDWATYTTVIDGSTSRSGEAAYNVIIGADDAALDGFTVRGGSGNPPIGPTYATARSGAGLLNSGTSPTVLNCVFADNSAYAGAAVACSGAASVVADCRFTGNTATYGGAVSLADNSDFYRCRFDNNVAEIAGGAIHLGTSSFATITDCTFEANQGTVSIPRQSRGLYRVSRSKRLRWALARSRVGATLIGWLSA